MVLEQKARKSMISSKHLLSMGLLDALMAIRHVIVPTVPAIKRPNLPSDVRAGKAVRRSFRTALNEMRARD
jgi:hypothetical protein